MAGNNERRTKVLEIIITILMSLLLIGLTGFLAHYESKESELRQFKESMLMRMVRIERIMKSDTTLSEWQRQWLNDDLEKETKKN